MTLTVDLVGLNLEKLLRQAAEAGVVIHEAERLDARTLRVQLNAGQKKALAALCERFGWEMREVHASILVRALRLLQRRRMLAVSAAVFVGLVYASSQTVWAVQIEQAGKDIGEVRRLLEEEGVHPGQLKCRISLTALREKMTLYLPDLAFVGLRWSGSTLVVNCQGAEEGEQALREGESYDLVASEPGIVTRLSVHSGTPQVKIGQAVYAGQVLVSGTERGEKGELTPVQAQGEVLARVFTQGEARVSRYLNRTVETGQTRTRVTLHTPWYARVVREAQPFESQDESTYLEPVVGLYLPVWREIETFAEIEIIRELRDEDEVKRTAEGAAEEIAKLKCPSGVEILDKWVDYSMIDDEFVYATVVLEYERDIATRPDGD